MKYNIKPRKTLYNDVLFRSRLEAKWAAFFDLVKWKWHYEPSEIAGYNPDFIIECSSDFYDTKHCIVEVKPLIFADEKYEKETLKKYREIKAHILILTDMPFFIGGWCGDFVCIGKGSQYLKDNNNKDFFHDEIYPIEMKSADDFGSNYMLFDGMIHGNDERKKFLKENENNYRLLIDQWKFAGNTVQFEF